MFLAALLALGLAAPRAPAQPKPPAQPKASQKAAPGQKAPTPPAPTPAPGGPNPELTRAEKLLDDLDYDGAALALLQARSTPGNERATFLRILELQGVIAAALDQKSSALSFFRQLLVLAPSYALSESAYSAEQRAPFLEAKASLASTPPLRFDVAPARAKPGVVESVVVKVAADPLSMARRVRFSLRVGDGPWKELTVPLAEGRASVPAGAETVSFWAQLLGEYDAQLAVIGSREKPIVLRAPTAAALQAAGGGLELGGYRPLAIALAGAGVVAAGAGAIFGYQASQASQQVATWRAEAATNGGVVRSVSMVDAQRVVNQANTNAIIADSLFGAAGVLGAGGVVLWFVEPEKPAGPPGGRPGAGGLRVSISGRF